MENNQLEVGEPIPREEATQVETPPKERTKRERFTVNISPTSLLVPPMAIMTGTGSREKKYKQWLEKETEASISMFNQLNVKKSIGVSGRKRFEFLRTLAFIALATDECQAVDYVYSDHSKIRLNVIKTLHDFIADNKDALIAIAPYLNVHRNDINPQ